MPRLTGESYVLDQPLYDTMQLAAAAGPLNYNFFSVPRGGVLAGAVLKDLRHTNLIQSGVLESHNLFTITGFSYYVREAVAAGTRPTFADIITSVGGSFELFLGNVSFFQIPAQMIPSGGAQINYFSNITPAATEFKATQGVSAVQNRYHLSQPIEMMNQESLRVVLNVPGTIAAVTDVTFVMWGNLVRPVR